MKVEPYTIEYLGKRYTTTIRKELTDDEYSQVVEGIMSRPELGEVSKQMASLAQGGSMVDKVYAYFVKDIAYKVRLVYNNWSIHEALKHKPLMEFFAGKVDDNKKVYPDSLPLYRKIETAFRLCGFKTCSKPSNFPIKAIDGLLGRFCRKGGNYMDFSCGWGVRLVSALKNRVNYFGTDPNDELVPRLEQIADLYRKVNGESASTDIRCQGSEVPVKEWVGIMDFCFTSPPYFSLEDYRCGEGQSYKEGTSYVSWVDNYVRPTIANCYTYLKDGGVFGFNIKNVPNYIPQDMEGDWDRISREAGFKHLEDVELNNITRISGHRHVEGENTKTMHNNNELIRLYIKGDRPAQRKRARLF